MGKVVRNLRIGSIQGTKSVLFGYFLVHGDIVLLWFFCLIYYLKTNLKDVKYFAHC